MIGNDGNVSGTKGKCSGATGNLTGSGARGSGWKTSGMSRNWQILKRQSGPWCLRSLDFEPNRDTEAEREDFPSVLFWSTRKVNFWGHKKPTTSAIARGSAQAGFSYLGKDNSEMYFP